MKKSSTLFGFFLLSTFAFAQIPAYQWAGFYGNGYSQDSYEVATDANDNMYIGGLYRNNNFDLDPGPGNAFVNAGSASDAFLIQVNSAGVYQWGFDIGNTPLGDAIYDLACTDAGNVVVTGVYSGNYVDVDPGPATYWLPNFVGGGSFASCYDINGNYLWQYTVTTTGSCHFYNVAVDDAGCVYICAQFTNTINPNPSGPESFTGVNNTPDILVIKLNANGVYMNAWQIGGTYAQQTSSIDIDDHGHFILTGHTSSVVDFDPGPGVYNLTTPVTQSDGFVASYDTNGTFNWAFLIPNGTFFVPEHVACDGLGNLFVTGAIEDTVDFDPGAGSAIVMSDNYGDGWLASYDSTGAFRFVFQIGTPGYIDRIRDVTVDPSNNVYIGGEFAGVNDFDPGAGYDTIRTHLNGQTSAAFVAKYTNTGAHQWAFHFQPTTSLGPQANVRCMEVSSNGNLFIEGYAGNDCDFDPNGTNLVTAGNLLTYVAKYGTGCVPPVAPTGISGPNVMCAGTITTYSVSPVAGASTYNWTLPAGWSGASPTNQIDSVSGTTSGTISVTASNACGTSTASTFAVTVNPLPVVTYTQSPDTFCIPGPVQTLSPGFPAGGTYVGTSVTGNTIDPSTLGQGDFYIDYIYTDSNGCTAHDTAWCYGDVCNGSGDADPAKPSLYPNPASSQFTIFNPEGKMVSVEIISADGKTVDQFTFPGTQFTYDSSLLASGAYAIRVQQENAVYNLRFLKE